MEGVSSVGATCFVACTSEVTPTESKNPRLRRSIDRQSLRDWQAESEVRLSNRVRGSM